MSDQQSLEGPVLIVGAGLLGTSLGLALRRRGITVWLRDVSPENLRAAMGMGAGQIVPDIEEGKRVLIAAHGNSLRALVKHLDNVSEADIVELNIPTGIPLVYELDADFHPVTPGGTYLDPEAAAAAIEAVKNQGKKK